jgi:endonuclease YncB( thermonuclease family)
MKKPRRKQTRRTGVKVWITAVAIVAALFFVGDSSPRLRQALERMLQEVVKEGPAREQHAGTARVIDGDTLDLAGTRIRLFGIDAPEGGQTCRIGRRD